MRIYKSKRVSRNKDSLENYNVHQSLPSKNDDTSWCTILGSYTIGKVGTTRKPIKRSDMIIFIARTLVRTCKEYNLLNTYKDNVYMNRHPLICIKLKVKIITF